MIQKMLVAARGETAIRVMQTCKYLGIRTVAVYATEDRKQLFVPLADEAVCIGSRQAHDCYTNVAAVVMAAVKTHADAVYPGNSVLSNSQRLARVCANYQLTLIGASETQLASLNNQQALVSAAKAARFSTVNASQAVGNQIQIHLIADRFNNVNVIGWHRSLASKPDIAALNPTQVSSMLQAKCVQLVQSLSITGLVTIDCCIDGAQLIFNGVHPGLFDHYELVEASSGFNVIANQIQVACGVELSTVPAMRQATVGCSVLGVGKRRITGLHLPAGFGILTMTAVYQGQAFDAASDATVAGIVTSGDSEPAALKRLQVAIDEMVVAGPETNLGLLMTAVTELRATSHPTADRLDFKIAK